MSIVQMSLPIPSSSSRNLSSFRFLSDPEQQLNLLSKFSQISLQKVVPKRGLTVIRMGGGPRTYPGGVSKWQWKRMQAKKQKQLLKARLLRERQIYEMRKRSELRAAVSELERPWEVVERAPTLFSVKADEQLKVLADRFRKPGGYDLWSERDGPQVFHTVDGVPSTSFFPKGVVHSIRSYESVKDSEELDSSEASRELGLLGYGNGEKLEKGSSNWSTRSRKPSNWISKGLSDSEDEDEDEDEGLGSSGLLGYGNGGELEKGSSNRSTRSRKPSKWISKGWSDSEDEDEDEGFRSSYSKNSRSLGSRGGRVGDVKRLGSANGREVSRDFNGGRGGKGSPNGGLRRNGTRQNVELRDFNGGRGGEVSPNGGLRRNGTTRQNVESRDLNWSSSGKANSDREGRNEVPFERSGRYGSNQPRQSVESRDSNQSSPEKGNFDRRGRYGNNRPGQSTEMRDSNWFSSEKTDGQSTETRDSNWLSSGKTNFDREGRNEVPFKGRGTYGSNRRSSARKDAWKSKSRKSSASKRREVYDMSFIGGDSYGFQETGQ